MIVIYGKTFAEFYFFFFHSQWFVSAYIRHGEVFWILILPFKVYDLYILTTQALLVNWRKHPFVLIKLKCTEQIRDVGISKSWPTNMYSVVSIKRAGPDHTMDCMVRPCSLNRYHRVSTYRNILYINTYLWLGFLVH